MRILMIGTAALALAACTNTTATEADNVAAANVTLTDNGAVEMPADNASLPMSGGAIAALKTADGKDVGTVTASTAEGGVTFTVDGRMMSAGRHGIHIHAVGKCEAPKFETAGPHWNPTTAQHGKDNPAGPHLGDLPNLDIGAGGTGTVTFMVKGASITGANGLLDADGAAFVVHAGPDDYKTDPSGNSGDRIACGTFASS